MRRAWLPLLILLGTIAAGGCSGRDPRFDLVPGPLSIRAIWATAPKPAGLGAEGWSCVDEAHTEYLRQYQELIVREATPLVRSFRMERGDAWRSDAPLIERYAARQAALIEAIARLDDAFIARIDSCGIEPVWQARLRTDRMIERSRVVIEAYGPPILDLRALAAPSGGATLTPELRAALDHYAVQLAALLPALRDAERLRPARQARALTRLQAENERLAPENQLGRRELDRSAQDEATVPVRRAMAALLDLNVRTVAALRSDMTDEAHAAMSERFDRAIDFGSGSGTGDPAIEWQIEVMASAVIVPPATREAIRERLDRFRERDRAVRARFLEGLRRGEAIKSDDPRRVDRVTLRTDLLDSIQSLLSKEGVDRLTALRSANTTNLETIVRDLAPASAGVLLARCPAALLQSSPAEDELPARPGRAAALFLPTAANEAWIQALLERCGVPDDARTVALQLWSDHAISALKQLERPMEIVQERESALGNSLSDEKQAARAIDAYFASIEEVRSQIAVIEERFFDELDPLLATVDEAARQRLRFERRLARERIDWRFVPFAELMGVGEGATVSAPLVISAVTMDPGERAIADELVRMHLPDLISEANGFRSESLSLLRRLVLMLARIGAEQGGEREIRAALPSLGEHMRASVARHSAAHRAVIDGVADALPARAIELHRAWRRAAFPEVFLPERQVLAIESFARQVSHAKTDGLRGHESRRARWIAALEPREERIVDARRAAIFDAPPASASETRDRLREWPELAAAVALWNEEHARFLRDVALLADDPRLTAQVDAWMRSAAPTTYWISE